MFGFGSSKIRKEAKEIISREFRALDGLAYIVSPMHEHVFKGVAKHISSQGGNAYDVAVGFMMVQMRSVIGPDDDDEEFWLKSIANKCDVLMSRGIIGSKVVSGELSWP